MVTKCAKPVRISDFDFQLLTYSSNSLALQFFFKNCAPGKSVCREDHL
jgi:hypothetical protein